MLSTQAFLKNQIGSPDIINFNILILFLFLSCLLFPREQNKHESDLRVQICGNNS